MVKKFSFVVSLNSDPDRDETQWTLSKAELLRHNKDLYDVLQSYKNNITKHYRSKKWDKYKKFANEYELVFTSCFGFPSISTYIPISRSFFKLWEILFDFKSELKLSDEREKTCLFLAEGPGGFVEAFDKYRRKLGYSKDKLYGVTLKSDDKNIPQWKTKTENFEILYGNDGSGNLYSVENVDSICNALGPTVDFVTGDGGFDFSSDFNGQEELSFILIASEVYCAISVLKHGGSFVLKIYDIFQDATIKLIYMLANLFQEVHIIKPLTSRPANSEKYILCLGFDQTHSNLYSYREQLKQVMRVKKAGLPDTTYPTYFLQSIVDYNVFYISKQSVSIGKTLAFIEHFNENTEAFMSNLKKQLEKAIRWCHKYSVPVSRDALKEYAKYFNDHSSKHT